MRGTLYNPPIVITQNRLKLILVLLFAVGFTIFWSAMLWNGAVDRSTKNYLALVLLAVSTPMITYACFRPGSLTLDRDGLTWRNYWRTFHYEWSDFASFGVISTSLFVRQP